MNDKVIFLYAFQAIFGVMGLLMAYMVLKYLNHKALGMQTINDRMIKDLIYLSLLFWFDTTITEFIEEYKVNPLNHKVVLLILFLNAMTVSAGIWQMSVILMMRYMSVFYQNLLNNVDDCVVVRVTRSFVIITSIMSAIMIDFENTYGYQLLTEKDSDYDNLAAIPILFAIFICMIILILTQYKIENFKKIVDSQTLFDQLEASNHNQEFGCTKYKIINTNRIEVGVLSITVLFVLFMPLWKSDSKVKLLGKTLIVQFISTIAIPIIFIVRNENMYSYFRCKIMKLLCCK